MNSIIQHIPYYKKAVIAGCFCLILCLPAHGQEQKVSKEDIKTDKFNVEYLLAEGMHHLVLENDAKAMESFQNAYEIMPENATVNYKIAQIHLKNEEFDQALFHATKAKENDTENEYFHLLVAQIYTQQGNLSEAVEAYEEMYEATSPPDDYLLELAALYLYNGNTKMSLKTYERVEKRLGIMEQVTFQKQKILLKNNQLEEAIQEGVKLSNAYPTVGEYAQALAELMIANNLEAQAQSFMEKYLEENPNQPKVQLILAKQYYKQSKVKAAFAYFERAFYSEEIALQNKLNELVPMIQQLSNKDLNPYVKKLGRIVAEVHNLNANALAVNGDMYFALQQKDSAIYYYDKAVQKDGTKFQIWQNLLSLEMEKGAYQKITQHTEEAIEYFPNQPVLYLFSGSAYFSLKQYDDAIMMFEQGKSIVYGDADLRSTFLGQLGDAYHAAKQHEKSFKAYEEAIKANPANYFAINNYSYYLSMQNKNLERAKELSTRLVKANPTNATYLDTHGWVLYVLGDYKNAKTYLEKAAKINPSGTIIEHYGDVLFKLDQIDQAVAQWKEAKKIGGASDLIDKKIKDRKLHEQ